MSDVDVITPGVLERTDLEIIRGVDNTFDVKWFDEAGDPVPFGAGSTGRVVNRETGAQVLDLTPRLSFAANVLTVSLPPAIVDALPLLRYGAWHIVGMSAAGDVRALCRGDATVVDI